jgi:hypothetical protein
MLSGRHNIGNRPPVETLAKGSQSVPHLRCYASPPQTEMCARCIHWIRGEFTLSALRAARDTFAWERQGEKLLQLYNRLGV